MTTHKRFAKSHDDVLEEIAKALDIPEAQYEAAVSRYQSIGEWLDRKESTLAEYDPKVSPQGSFLLGTVTRPLGDGDVYDVDLVCLLTASKQNFTQKALKEAVGLEVAAYTKARNMLEQPEEHRRCWRILYAEETKFYMDVLPALPDAQSYRIKLEQRGYTALARDASQTAIAITDWTLPQYAQRTDDWPLSNPLGYAAWFRTRMTTQLILRKRVLAEQQKLITASVDDIPDYKVKTPLQRAIQLLKRHRDSMFEDDGEHKPISIIITTLSAHAYNDEATIADALITILTRMDQFIQERNGKAWIPNPVNPEENFADKWAEVPKKRENFYAWLKKARQDFAHYLRGSAFDMMPLVLKEGLGENLVDRTLKSIIPAAATIVAPAIVKASPDGLHRAEAEIKEIQRTGTQSKPWAE
jgi:hypothetical protein